MPPAFSPGAAAPTSLSPEPTRSQGRGGTGSLAGPAGWKAQGQLLRGCSQLWFWMNETSPRARYFTSGRNTFLEQSEDRGGEKEMFSRLFSTTQPSQHVFKVPWPEAAVSDPKLVLLLWPPPRHRHTPNGGCNRRARRGGGRWKPVFKHTVMKFPIAHITSEHNSLLTSCCHKPPIPQLELPATHTTTPSSSPGARPTPPTPAVPIWASRQHSLPAPGSSCFRPTWIASASSHLTCAQTAPHNCYCICFS